MDGPNASLYAPLSREQHALGKEQTHSLVDGALEVRCDSLEFGAWDLFGIWDLELGASGYGGLATLHITYVIEIPKPSSFVNNPIFPRTLRLV